MNKKREKHPIIIITMLHFDLTQVIGSRSQTPLFHLRVFQHVFPQTSERNHSTIVTCVWDCFPCCGAGGKPSHTLATILPATSQPGMRHFLAWQLLLSV